MNEQAGQSLILPGRAPERDRSPVPAQTEGATIMAIIERMSREQTFDYEKIRQMMDIKKEWEANEARKAFVADMAAFKLNPPKIYKNKHVGFNSRDGESRTDYDHATHDEVTMKIIAGLAEHGFSHRWIPTQPNGQVCVTCVITHRLGHSESLEMVAPPDVSGKKSPVQAIASTKTLLERYTLLAATGLSAADMPDADDKTDGGDGNDDNKPTVHNDVWLALGDAATGGEEDLRAMWNKLSETTRNTILAGYATDWSQIKAKAKAVDLKQKAIDTAHHMRQLMATVDADEEHIAKLIFAENERLSREAVDLFNTAWDILQSNERRIWKEWVDLGRKYGK